MDLLPLSLAFLVWDSENTHFCFGNADIPSGKQADEILKFAEYWKNRQGGENCYPKELIFDSTLTTYSDAFEGLPVLLGGFSGEGLQNDFRNGTPNAMNILLWQIVLSKFAGDVATSCGTDNNPVSLGYSDLDGLPFVDTIADKAYCGTRTTE